MCGRTANCHDFCKSSISEGLLRLSMAGSRFSLTLSLSLIFLVLLAISAWLVCSEHCASVSGECSINSVETMSCRCHVAAIASYPHSESKLYVLVFPRFFFLARHLAQQNPSTATCILSWNARNTCGLNLQSCSNQCSLIYRWTQEQLQAGRWF